MAFRRPSSEQIGMGFRAGGAICLLLLVVLLLIGLPFGMWEIVILIAWPAAWGVGCAVWERFGLSPRRLAAVVPPLMSGLAITVLLTGVYVVQRLTTAERGLYFEDVIFLAGIFFAVGVVWAPLAFFGMRRLIRKA